ncbi:hypothetical protein N431DRAFT_475689 [Stipitochalara longipes BDJ]|nr:hypothetical protein N431DRAFT_475689 [Stipitochalara longipes BDJ]
MVGKSLMAMVGLGKDKETGKEKGKGRALELQPQDGRDISEASVVESNAPESFKRQRREKYGLFELSPEDQVDTPGERYAVDFVSVHGITGDAYSTWTAANGVLWLKDFLPRQFPGAKVYSFGYPAEVFYSKSAAGLDMQARALLEVMKAYGVGMKQNRKTIFLCHSMGGIVVKKAILTANHDAIDYQRIKSSISAILFFGTPHRGADLASLAQIFTKIYSVANYPISGLVGSTRTDLVSNLEKDSPLLTEMAMDIRNQLTEVKIASFVEMANTLPFNTVVVDTTTATMNREGERVIPMMGRNHSEICRFEDEHSSAYIMVLGVLKEWALREGPTQDDIACLRSLAFLDMESRRSVVARQRHPHTCEWVLQNKNYQNWIDRSRGLLWLMGNPGSGKSTIMSFLRDRLDHESNSHADSDPDSLCLDFFFNARGQILHRTLLGMLRALLHQLARKFQQRKTHLVLPALRSIFEKKITYGTPGVDWQWQVHELDSILQDVLIAIAKTHKVVIFLDALDEAGDGAIDVLNYLHSANDKFTSEKSTVRICVACRYYPILSAVIPGLHVDIGTNNKQDIERFVHDEITSKAPAAEFEADRREWTNMERSIVRKAAGLFQWARLVTGFAVEQHREGMPWREIRYAIANVPKGLDDVYRHIFEEIIKKVYQERTLLLIQLVCFAGRHLSLIELRYAIATGAIRSSRDRCEDSEWFMESDDRMRRHLTALSGGLIEFVVVEGFGDRAQFVHQSVIDFLIPEGLGFLMSRAGYNGQSQDSKVLPERLVIGNSHDRLCRLCISYLSLREVYDLTFTDAEWENPNLEDIMEERSPLISYAADNWYHHAKQSERYGARPLHLISTFNTTSPAFENWAGVVTHIYGMEIEGYDIDETSTLWHIAASLGLKSVMQAFMTSGADVDQRDNQGRTALHYSSEQGNAGLATLLLDWNADINAVTKSDWTPLSYAVKKGCLEILALLLARGCCCAEPDGLLEEACALGSIQIIRCLLNHLKSVDDIGKLASTALDTACSQSGPEST